MDTKLAERRKGVSEDKARRRLKWVLFLLVFILLVVGVAWLVRSPLLSISDVTVNGAVESDPMSVVADLGMGVGIPTMDVDGGAIERGVRDDPWVADARVIVAWPGSLTIDVVEHPPVSVVSRSGTWIAIAPGGALVEEASLPGADGSAIDIDVAPSNTGDTTDDANILGALEFIEALAPDLRGGTVVSLADDGLEAIVAGHDVRLGRPVEMDDKAIVLESLIASGLEQGAAIDLIAPTRPAVTNPQPLDEGEE